MSSSSVGIVPAYRPFDHPQLADVLLTHIFHFIDATEALLHSAVVCKRFYHLATNPLAKRTLRLHVSRNHQLRAIFDQLLPNSQLVRLQALELSIPDRSKLLEMNLSPAWVSAIVAGAPRLQSLYLNCIRIHFTSIEKFAALTHLTALSLDFTPSSSMGLSASSVTLDQNYYTALLGLKRLRFLRFHCTWNGRASFLQKLGELSQLEILNLKFKQAEIDTAVCESWSQGLKKLHTLILHRTTTKPQEDEVFYPLAQLPALTRLDVPHAVCSIQMMLPLNHLQSLSILIAENVARNTNSSLAPLRHLNHLTHLQLGNPEGQADALIKQLVQHVPITLTSLQLTLDHSLTSQGCETLQELNQIKYLTLLHADFVLDDQGELPPRLPTAATPASGEKGTTAHSGGLSSASEDRISDCPSVRFLSRLRYLHVTRLSMKNRSAGINNNSNNNDRLSFTQSLPIMRNPLEFLARHAHELEVLRVDECAHLSLLPLRGAPRLQVIGDMSPTLFGRGNPGGTRSNLVRHPSLSEGLRTFLESHRYPLMKNEWHRSSNSHYGYSKQMLMLPVFLPTAKTTFFRMLEEHLRSVNNNDSSIPFEELKQTHIDCMPTTISNIYSRTCDITL